MSLSRIALIGGLYGVEFTRIGYTGGIEPHPCYLHIGDHTEVVEVNYNKRIISLSDILRVFFENHDYTMPLPKRYASSIFFTESSQYDEAASFMRTRLSYPAVTRLSPLVTYHDAEHMFHKYYLQNTPTVMLQLLYEYNWDWKTWFSEFNILPFVTKLKLSSRLMRRMNAALSGLFPPEYVLRILDSINIPDSIKRECKLRASHIHPQCILM
ncbi:Ecdysone-induced protein [Blastocystis sp. ATCC 50177/Nand II]|uniref:peptide-methionine (S)-S-oxide reductase n=1 Tax=Blastocystis sp. subtype 1 (strain ATCC 50177 / NandII) TaxID=478820 RepID=A0A196SD10_BLAHN|nr:Ecdysone-induced protein [Blastocystis sp. ATCC 50177/Nand II]